MADEITASTNFTVLGGGLAGALMAVYLKRAGYSVKIIEKRNDPRSGIADAGRSVNLALSTRGIVALREVGALDAILSQAIPMRGRMLHDQNGKTTFQSYGSGEDEALYSVSRLGINLALLNFAEQEGVPIEFGKRCEGVDLQRSTLRLAGNDSSGTEEVPYNILIGADGAFSAVRSEFQRKDRYNFEQHFIEHGYKELTIPAAADGNFAIDKNSLHIWPRGSFMMIALPNSNGSFTCTLFWPYHGRNSFEELTRAEDIKRFFETTFPDAVPLMPTLIEDFMNNPVGSLVTIRCYPWQYDGKVALIGDACHAVLPFYGQGMNAAFEDCTVLNRLIKEHAPNFNRAFSGYQEARKPHVDTLADLAYDNFIEMRDKVNSPIFLLWKKIENALHSALPWLFVSLHGIVSFSTTPYLTAVKRVRLQNRLLGGAAIILLLFLLRLI